MLDLVESTRVEAFKIRRSEVDREELAERLGGLDIRSANHVIRAFSHFSLLANLAEDIHHERRRRFHRREGSPPQKGSLAAAFQAIDAADLDADAVARELTGALVCPVVTAHPTEVRRKTISAGAAAGHRPHPRRPAMQVTLFGRPGKFIATRGARHLATARREGGENRIETLNDLCVATDHHAITTFQAPDAAAGSDIDVVNT